MKTSFSLFGAVKTVITTPLPSQIQATKGLPKTLQCAVQKDPDITVKWTWTKDGSPVDTAGMTVQADGSLRITTVQEVDAGSYTCRVESVAGNAATSGTMSVQGKRIHYNLLKRGRGRPVIRAPDLKPGGRGFKFHSQITKLELLLGRC